MTEPVDPEEVEANEDTAKALRQTAALAGVYYEALTASKVPSHLAEDLVRDWHNTYWESPIRWPAEDE